MITPELRRKMQKHDHDVLCGKFSADEIMVLLSAGCTAAPQSVSLAKRCTEMESTYRALAFEWWFYFSPPPGIALLLREPLFGVAS